ncbi:hypothetical protein ACKRZS_000710 [Fusarium odoratissimum]
MDEPDGTDPNRSPPHKRPKTVHFPAWASSWRFNAYANDVPEVNSLSTHLATTGQPGNAEPGTGELQPFASDDNPSTTEQHNTESGKAESNVNQTVKTHLRLPLELREIVYCCAIRQECSCGFPSGLNQARTTLDKDHSAKACEMETFQFNSSSTLRVFAELSHTHFENYSGFMPRVDAKILVFESASFPGAPVLNGWDRTDQAHGDYTNAQDHVEDWVDAVLNVSTNMGIDLHFCRPWRNFGYLSGVTAPLRDAGYDLSVTWDEINCLQVPDQFSSFLMAMTARSITREQLDDTNLQFQSNLSEDTAWTLVHYGAGATLSQAFDPTGKGEISWEQRKIPAMK